MSLRLRAVALLAAATAAVSVCAAVPSAADAEARSGSHVVVAVIDDGINPYQLDFRSPRLTGPPAAYLPAYPRSAAALRLTLGSDYSSARHTDDPAWAGLVPRRLYYVPGTKIVGLVYVPGSAVDDAQKISVDTDPSADPVRPVVDGSPHGTKVASVLAGNRHGSCPACLLVVVAAANRQAGLEWAAQQPWIDIVSNSYGGPTDAPTGGSVAGRREAGAIDQASHAAAAAGKPVFFASGNGLTGTGPYTAATPDRGNTWTSPYSGPPWVASIGAADAETRQPSSWHDVPVDATSFGQNVPAADSASVDGESTFYGTSCAAPYAAGIAGAVLLALRFAARDHGVGYRHGSLVARGIGAPPAFKHIHVSRQAFLAAVLRSARPTGSGATAAWMEGFGLLTRASIAPATAVLLGSRPQQPRAEDSTHAQSVAVRAAVWGPDIPN